jgi:hypothetical protein
MVEAQQTAAGLYWPSAPDSGYSVDNLRPTPPAGATGVYASGTTQLDWSPNLESDLAGYHVYRGGWPGFTPSAGNLIAQLATSSTHLQDVAGRLYVYKLTALDVHGNESAAATILPSGTTAVQGTALRVLSLTIEGTNPTSRATTIGFSLPAEAAVSLAVHDAAGRRMRTLSEGTWAVGEHHLMWDLRDATGQAVRPGLYFVRLTVGGETRVRRVAVVE